MKFDEKFLQEVGLAAMPEQQKQSFLEYVQEELEVRIGMKIAEKVTTEELRRFEGIDDEDEAVEWLHKNCPDYAEIVEAEIDELKEEIAANREKILS